MLRLRGRLGATLGALVLASTVLLAGAPALAQTGGYPPGTSVPTCTPGNANAGNVNVGQTITFTLCGGFADGASVTITVNGTAVTTKTPVNGAVTVVIRVVSTTVLEIDDPTNATAVCGANTVVATGSGTPGTSTGTFNLTCTTTTTAGSGATTSTTKGSGATTTTTGGSLAFTGARVLELILIALGLIILGALLVTAQRRRRQHPQP